MPAAKPAPSNFFSGELDFDGKGSERRTALERAELLRREIESPKSYVYRPIKQYGLLKLKNLSDYLWSYAAILNTRFRGRFGVVDGFAGPGMLDLRTAPPEGVQRIDDAPSEPELALGSPLLELSNHPSYPQVHLVEKEGAAYAALRARVEFYYPGRAELHCGDANDILPELAKTFSSRRYRALFVLDPEGLELRMSTLHQIRDRCAGAEIFALYPSHMAVARCVTIKGTWPRLGMFFGNDVPGPPARSWQAALAAHGIEVERLASGEDESRISEVHDILLAHYLSRLASAGFESVLASPVIRSDYRRPLYHLVFAGNNATGEKIMRRIFGRVQVSSARQEILEAFGPTSAHQESDRSGASKHPPTA